MASLKAINQTISRQIKQATAVPDVNIQFPKVISQQVNVMERYKDRIIDGKAIAEKIKKDLKHRIITAQRCKIQNLDIKSIH
jgi:hypothetical protein